MHFSIKSLPGEDFNVSATTIARELGLGHVLVRKDLAKISDEGRCRTGRSRMKLIQDIEGYLEQKDFNHFFRIAETVALRIKNPKAIVQFELQK